MPIFLYKAIDESGNARSGEVEAESLETATSIITERGFIPSKITEETRALERFSWSAIEERLGQVRTPDLILFSKQFRTMIRAGVPILPLLQVLENQTENPTLRRVIGSITKSIQRGSTLYDAFRRHPRVFSPLYCSLLRAGESSGALVEVMDRLIFIVEHEHRIKSDIKSALQYPIFVVIFLAIAFFVLLTVVIPKFVRIFTRSGLDLPLPTRICMSLYQFLSDYWYLVLGGTIMGIIALIFYFRTEQGKYVKDTIFLKLPIFGPLFTKTAMSRFASIFAILHASGINVLESIKILSGTIGNAAISREFDQVSDRVEEGRGIAGPLRATQYFTPMVTNMVAIAEESGKLDEMLRDVSEHYDDEVDYAIKRLSEAIGPILTVGLAAVIGFFALAIFLPMWDLTKLAR